jgi:magnesium-transporting ATPase (P-type)
VLAVLEFNSDRKRMSILVREAGQRGGGGGSSGSRMHANGSTGTNGGSSSDAVAGGISASGVTLGTRDGSGSDGQRQAEAGHSASTTNGSGRLLLMTKGADSVVLRRLADGEPGVATAEEHLVRWLCLSAGCGCGCVLQTVPM